MRVMGQQVLKQEGVIDGIKGQRHRDGRTGAPRVKDGLVGGSLFNESSGKAKPPVACFNVNPPDNGVGGQVGDSHPAKEGLVMGEVTGNCDLCKAKHAIKPCPEARLKDVLVHAGVVLGRGSTLVKRVAAERQIRFFERTQAYFNFWHQIVTSLIFIFMSLTVS